MVQWNNPEIPIKTGYRQYLHRTSQPEVWGSVLERVQQSKRS
ncbi:hypothetical protein KKC1_16100 [Calderihabitans maritimus]|uniref:Uncharacterized protein n=1 Tax=Calderihabitans maritimus TaxID=1246530 RepID=A0A1Z5HSE9_9FIRM|nr:hypothetical protein KKC1_16100 [Calderihabitans maritimus]